MIISKYFLGAQILNVHDLNTNLNYCRSSNVLSLYCIFDWLIDWLIDWERERERESSLGSWCMFKFDLGNYNHTTRNIYIIKITLFWSMVCNDEPRVSRSKPNIISITDVWSLNFTTPVIVALVSSTVIVCTEHSYWCKS